MGIDKLRALRGELETVFAVENDSHSWTDLRALDMSSTVAQQMHDRAEHKVRLAQQNAQVHGRKSEGSNVAFGLYLCGDGVALDTDATPANDTLQDLLELCMGGSASGAGSTAAADCTTTVINVQAGHGTRFAAGKAIMVEGTGPAGENEISIIESISTDALTLKIALSSAPSPDDEVWNSYTAYLDSSATATWQFQALHDDTALIFDLLGAVGRIALANILGVSDLPRVNFELQVTDWEVNTDDDLSDVVGTYDGAAPLGTTEGMEVHWQTHGTSARNLISVSALEVDPGITWTLHAARGNGDRQHIQRAVMTGIAPTATFTADPLAAFWTVFTAKTEKILAIMFGRTAGSSWCIEVPRAVMSAVPVPGAHGEQPAQQITLRAHEDDCGDATTALMRSSIRIHRL